MAVKVITNHHPREVVDAWQLTAQEREEFDYLDWPAIEEGRDSAHFVRYKGELLDLGEFLRIDYPYFGQEVEGWTRQWDGIRADSAFSALVVRYADGDGETVVMGRALS